MPFWPLCCESEAILFKKFCASHRAGVFIWENFHPGYRDLGGKTRDLSNRASPASHMNTSAVFKKKRVARRGLGNRASPVDRAHMKRPYGAHDQPITLPGIKHCDRAFCV